MSLGLGVDQTPFQPPPCYCDMLPEAQGLQRVSLMTRLIPLMHPACVPAPCSLEALRSKPFAVEWRLETGCGCGSTHMMPEHMHQIAQDAIRSHLKCISVEEKSWFY